MKNKSVFLVSLLLTIVFTLSACSSPLAGLPEQAASLIDEYVFVDDESAESEHDEGEHSDNDASPSSVEDPGLLAAYQNALEEVYTNVNPQVVNITVLVDPTTAMTEIPFDELPEMPGFPGLPEGGEAPEFDDPFFGQGAGSGFVWDEVGHIVTNNHVVAGAEDITVTFYDGTTVSAELVGADPDSDLAVLVVDMPEDELFPVELADEDHIKVGQLAIAIGNPFGLDGTMTVGIVSALGRTIPATAGLLAGPSYSIPEIVQTDAPINPGNSGGVLVNSDGQVIGVTAAIESPIRANAGIGFAIPVSIVEKVIPVLIEDGEYAHSFLGISGLEMSPDAAEAMDLDPGQRGALVITVVPDGPAERAGLAGSDRQVEVFGQQISVGGDVIVAVDGQSVKGMDDLIAYLTTETIIGQEITVSIIRDGKEIDLEVTLAARPAPESLQMSIPDFSQSPHESADAWMGIMVMELGSEIAAAMDLSEDQQGILVIHVEEDSPAYEVGLQGSEKSFELDGEQLSIGGDIITEFDGNTVTSVAELLDLLAQAEPGQEVELTILRDGELIQVTMTLAERPS